MSVEDFISGLIDAVKAIALRAIQEVKKARADGHISRFEYFLIAYNLSPLVMDLVMYVADFIGKASYEEVDEAEKKLTT